MNATYIISIARKLGCSIFLLPEDIIEVLLPLHIFLKTGKVGMDIILRTYECNCCPSLFSMKTNYDNWTFFKRNLLFYTYMISYNRIVKFSTHMMTTRVIKKNSLC